jgi:hypothetical protein
MKQLDKRTVIILVILAVLFIGYLLFAPSDPAEPNLGTQPTGTQGATLPSQPPAACQGHDSDPYKNVNKDEFYADYTPACCYVDACYRTQHHLMSGYIEVPDQYPTISSFQPSADGVLLRNTDCYYLDDGNTYVVVDAYGQEMLRVYKGAAYITLEEVAAYMFAFGGSNKTLPANYTSAKSTKPTNNPWGIFLRVNHSFFKGDTDRYPYEPELPNISGCGGSAEYYEMDIGTTGTYTGDGYPVKMYNDGTVITRGAARIVYTRQDLNRNGIYEPDEVYLFYTANHYNDFREYLNYYGGWGEIFGNETGGGKLSSEYDYNPTPYVPTGYASFQELYRKY